MTSLIGCGAVNVPALAASFAAGAALVVAASLAAKAFLARLEPPRPPMWQTVALTACEPLAYVAAPLGLLFLEDLGWSLAIHPAAVVLVGASVAFVCIGGFHGALLGRVDPEISEARRFGLSLLYSLPVPGFALASTSLLMFL